MKAIARLIRNAALATVLALLQGCPVATDQTDGDSVAAGANRSAGGNATSSVPFVRHCTYTYLSNGAAIKTCH